MKKYLPVLFAASILSVPAAQAATYQPYLGFDIQYHMLSYDDVNGVNVGDVLDDSSIGANFHIGTRIGDHFGLELGYDKYHDSPRDNVLGTNLDTSITRNGLTLDGFGYIPLNDSGMLEGIVTAGVGWIWNEISVNATPLGLGNWGDNDSEFDLRFGGGLQYQVSDKFNIRGLLRYQTLDLDGGGDREFIGMAGVNYLLGKK